MQSHSPDVATATPHHQKTGLTAVPTRQEVTDAVNGYLREFFTSQRQTAQAFDTHYGRLWQAAETLVLAGGKRIRPYLTIVAYKAFDGRDDTAILPVAVAQELLHAALLMHDDIIDRDTIRYGRSNVMGQYREHYAGFGLTAADREHFSNGAAILAGDLLLSNALSLIAESSFEAKAKFEAHRLLHAGLLRVAGGELLDMESTFTDWHDVDPIVIAKLKTASYSFETPLLTGAGLAGAGNDALHHLGTFAHHTGIAFQLTDDLLGVFGNNKETGKSTTSDLEERKVTLLLQETLKRSDTSAREYILKHCGHGPLETSTVEQIKTIIEQSGARTHTENRAKAEVQAALQALANVGMPKPFHDALESMARNIITRKD